MPKKKSIISKSHIARRALVPKRTSSAPGNAEAIAPASTPVAPATRPIASPTTTLDHAGASAVTAVHPSGESPNADAPPPTPDASTGAAPATTTAPAVAAGIAMPPDVTIPEPPANFVAPKLTEFRGYHPTQNQVSKGPQAIVDLGHFVDYETVLGTSAPPIHALVEALQAALAWRALRDPTEAWDTYVRAQDGSAWMAALTLLDQMKPLFLIAVARNPALGGQYPGLAAIFGAAKRSAKLGQTTRKNNAKAKAAAVAASARAAATATSTATEPASTSKSVTVNT